MPEGVGYGQQQGQQPSQGGLAAKMPNAAAIAQQFQGQQRPFGWLMDMISHITGQLSTQGGQPQQQQPAPQGQQPPADTTPQGQGPGPQKQSQDGQQPAPQQMGQGGMIDPTGVQQLVSLFQPNALSNLGLLPQQQGNWNWVLSMMQQQMAGQAQQRGQGGADLVSVLRQLRGMGGQEAGPSKGSNGEKPSSGSSGGSSSKSKG